MLYLMHHALEADIQISLIKRLCIIISRDIWMYHKRWWPYVALQKIHCYKAILDKAPPRYRVQLW